MTLIENTKPKKLTLVKKVSIVLAFPVVAMSSAIAAAPDVSSVVSDISALEGPVALVGGAYIGLKVFQRGWRIIKGFI